MKVTVIGVAGGTGSGKSTLVKRLQETFKGDDVATLCHDYYYKAHPELTYEERTKLNYDHPAAFDTDMLVEHIRTLKSNVPVEHPVYSFVDHNRTDEKVLVKPSKVIIVDGILIFENKEQIWRSMHRTQTGATKTHRTEQKQQTSSHSIYCRPKHYDKECALLD